MSQLRRRLLGGNEVNIPNYLCLTITAAGAVKFNIPSGRTVEEFEYVEYSTDGKTWTKTNNVDSTSVDVVTPSYPVGTKVYWRGKGTNVGTTNNACQFKSNGNTKYTVSGDSCSLKDPVDFEQLPNDGTVCRTLFKSNNNVVAVRDFVIKAPYAYVGTFQQCMNLAEIQDIVIDDDVPDWNMTQMFTQTKVSTVNIYVSGNVKGYGFGTMFGACGSLTEMTLNVRGTYNANSRSIISSCPNLSVLKVSPTIYADIHNWNIPSGCTVIELD